MPQQLIYTSAPRGIVAGRSGHCTVARSASMREALMLQLEKFCYYQHLSLSGGQERPIFACRVVDIRGTRFHVLSRIQDAGLDFTGRTNFIAHHLVFTPEEIRQFPTPPVILRDWPGWVKSWTKEPQLLDNEDWTELTALAVKTSVPAQAWQRVTGDAVNGYGLLEARAGDSFRVDDQTDETILGLLAESLELLEVRDTRRDFRAAAWNYTFTTSMQEQDNPADFRWRCIHSDNPAANRFATPDCRALSAVRATKWTGEETAFARTGRQAPRFVAEPQDTRITEGETARFTAKAEGVPNPSYQWFSVDRANNGQILPGETNPELVVSNPALGTSRYVVSATNSVGNVQSRVATLSVEQKLKLAQVRADTGSRGPAKLTLYNVKSGDDIERQRRRFESEKAQEIFKKRLRRNKILVMALTIVLIAVAGVFGWKRFAGKKLPAITQQPAIQTNKDGVVTIAVFVTGTSPLTYQWYRDNQPISSTTNPTLPLKNIELTNSVSFLVIITNMAGSVTSAVVQWQGTPPTPPPAAVQSGTVSNADIATEVTHISTPTPEKTMLQDGAKQLPAPWTYANVGNPTQPKVPSTDSGTFTFIGTGKNFSGNTDSFFFASQLVSNSVEFIARLSKVSRGTNACQCGIMLRESKKSDASFVFLGISSTNIIWTQRHSSGAVCTNAYVSAAKLPIFLRLRRNTDLFIGEISTNGIDWNWGKTNKISMTETNYLLGFAVTSGKPALEVNADFDSITNHLNEAKP
jgi:predicted nucleic acid-binding Zn ribbon protein